MLTIFYSAASKIICCASGSYVELHMLNSTHHSGKSQQCKTVLVHILV